MKHKSLQGDENSALPTIEFCLHKGTSYDRGLVILNDDSEQVTVLKQLLDSVTVEMDTINAETQSPSMPKRNSNGNNSICQRVVTGDSRTSRTGTGSAEGQTVQTEECSPEKVAKLTTGTGPVHERCMLQTLAGQCAEKVQN